MKIALLGYGRMGKTIEKVTDKHEIVYKTNENPQRKKLKEADAAIDFSVAEAAFKNITTCFEENIPVVSGTTGWLENYDKAVENCEAQDGAFLYASNFSIGVNLFFELNKTLARMMKNFGDYNVDIEEIHHTQKKDKPSGTAITLAESIINESAKTKWELVDGDSNESNSQNTIPVAAKRFKDVKGTHKINYQSDIDAIEIKHTAFSREGFAKGALLAAEYIANKKGVFSMQEVLKNLI